MKFISYLSCFKINPQVLLYKKVKQRKKIIFLNQSFKIWWLNRGIKVMKKIQHFSSISLKLCLLHVLGHKTQRRIHCRV